MKNLSDYIIPKPDIEEYTRSYVFEERMFISSLPFLKPTEFSDSLEQTKSVDLSSYREACANWKEKQLAKFKEFGNDLVDDTYKQYPNKKRELYVEIFLQIWNNTQIKNLEEIQKNFNNVVSALLTFCNN